MTRFRMRKQFAVITLLLAALWGGAASAQQAITWNDFSKPVYGTYWYCTGYSWMTCADCYYSSPSDYKDQCRVYVEEGGWDPEQLDCNACTSWAQGTTQVGWTRLPSGDVITVQVESGLVAANAIAVRLITTSSYPSLKRIDFGVTDRWMVWTEGGTTYCNWPSPVTYGCNTVDEWAQVMLSPQATVVFSERPSGAGGEPQRIYVLGNLSQRLKGGDRVTFTWREG